ncbi:CooT family nickel-binding protein [Desulfopila sp. IMCC35008]|uniref:CooT family nickel-binding protein n=1 Tax=Desulfopila sp. IMCC35008 TaxID=2653858 RepID=UPI0013D07679|nr:CooT family nickel-binding protein [Desulfopila sp. IMCC35008]
MCEIKVVMDKDGIEEPVMENVTKLDILDNAVAITSLFEGVKEIPGVTVRNIDFLAGTVFLQPQQ